MAEVPPGPNALPASPAEILALSVGGCALLGSNEDRAVSAAGQHQAAESKGLIKSNHNNLQTQQLNGLVGRPQAGHQRGRSHLIHPAYKKRLPEDGENAGDENNAPGTDCGRGSCPRTQNHTLPACAAADSGRPEPDSPRVGTKRTSGRFREDRGDNGSVCSKGGVEGLSAHPGPASPAAEMARLALDGRIAEEEEDDDVCIGYVRYESELQMPDIIRLITKDLSEPYSIYTYRYFIHNWPQLCFLAMVENDCVGAIVCKLDMHKKMFRRGYIAMLAVDSKFRRKGIGTNLVKKAIYAMVEGDCDEVVLETEITNKSALKLYENLGFVRDKRLFRYYLNGVDALRLKLWLR